MGPCRLVADFTVSSVVASYWIGLFGPLVVILVGYKTVFIQHHAWQGLFVTTALWVLSLAFVWNWIAFLVLALFSIGCFTALTLKVRQAVEFCTEFHLF